MCTYSYGHGISSVILVLIRKNLCSRSFIVTMTDIQNFCDTIKIKMPHDIHPKNFNVGLEIYKTCFTGNVS
jgi:hypothetical protein